MIRRTLLCVVSLLFAATAYAHAHLEKSTPAEKSVLAALPESIVLNFSQAVRLTALSIERGDGTSEPIAPLPAEAGTTLAVVAPALPAGEYVIAWRALSKDNHVMSGKIHFTVAPQAATEHSAHH